MPCYYHTEFILFNIINLIQLDMKTIVQLILTHLDTEVWIIKDILIFLSPISEKGAGLYSSHILLY